MTAIVRSREELAEYGPPRSAPSRRRLYGEIGTALQPVRLAGSSVKLARAQRGDGRTAIVLPGWRANDLSTLPIRKFLDSLGHRSRPWGLGTNLGDVESLRDTLVPKVQELADRTGRAVNLAGWSLGGVVAREVARAVPDAVNHVVTYGSPIIGGPTYTVGAVTYPLAEQARIRDLQVELDETSPIVTPITAMFTRRDNVVDWRACVDLYSLNVTMIEVQSTHIGLGLDPDVWLTTAKALAEP